MPKHEGKIELHAHTTASDGCLTPQDLVRFADESGIKHLALTDHDSTAGLALAREYCANSSVEIITGIELSSMQLDREIHLLGYFFDEHNQTLQNKLQELVADRSSRAERMIRKFNSLGYPLGFDEVKKKAGPNGLLGRPHVALVLVEHGIVNSINEAFDKFLNPGRPGYVPRLKLSPAEAIQLIKTSGGIPVLAHPGVDFSPSMLPDCLDAGLMGIECYHPKHTPLQTEIYLEIAQRHNLIITGGSDFHGYEREDWKYFGSLTPVEALLQLKRFRKRLG